MISIYNALNQKLLIGKSSQELCWECGRTDNPIYFIPALEQHLCEKCIETVAQRFEYNVTD